MKNFDNPSDDLQKKITDCIMKSGFPFEWDVRDRIMKARIKLSSDYYSEIAYHRTYIDPEESKLRETDVSWDIFSSNKSPITISWYHYFECKSSDKDSWIFFTEPQTSRWHSYSLNLRLLEMLPELHSDPTKVLNTPIHYGRQSSIAYSSLTFPDGSSHVIRSAIYQAIKSCYVDHFDYVRDLQHENRECIDTIVLYFPIVVFSGYLFEFRYTKSGGTLLPAKHIVFEAKHTFSSRARPNTFLVDIVRDDYLSSYLTNQAQDITAICEYLIREKPQLESIRLEKLQE